MPRLLITEVSGRKCENLLTINILASVHSFVDSNVISLASSSTKTGLESLPSMPGGNVRAFKPCETTAKSGTESRDCAPEIVADASDWG